MVVSKSARVGSNVVLGDNVVIEDNVVIADNVVIGHNVVIRKDTHIGEGCMIGDGTILGKKPFRALASATTEERQLPPLALGKYVTVGANCVIYRGAILGNFVFVGDLATIREDVEIGEYTIIGRGVAVENKTKVGKYVKIETNAYITAMSTIEDYCFIAPEVTFTNDNFLGRTEERKKYFKGPTVRKGARIGANATILPGVEIAEDCLIAAGSVVTKNTVARKIYIGVPAKEYRDVPKEQLLENQSYYKR
ncbi:MAG: DapH/DapD/GlmU-related protein [Pseudothermotoga sp.]